MFFLAHTLDHLFLYFLSVFVDHCELFPQVYKESSHQAFGVADNVFDFVLSAREIELVLECHWQLFCLDDNGVVLDGVDDVFH